MLRNSAIWLLKTFALILILFSCVQKGTKEYRLITAKDDLGVLNLTRFHTSLYIYADSAGVGTMPVKNGDLLDIWKEDIGIYVRCTPEFPDTFELRAKNGLCFINEKLIGITIYPSPDSLQMFRQMKETDLKNVQTVSINNYILDEHLPFLDSLSKINPEISLLLSFSVEDSSFSALNVDSNSTSKKSLPENRDSLLQVFRKNLTWLSERFKPKLIAFIGPVTEVKNLVSFKTIETLNIQTTDNSLKDNLPSLPRLKELIILSDSDSLFITANYFDLNPQLEQLTINGSINPAIIDWKKITKLKALRVFSPDSLYAFPYGNIMPNLQSLQLSGNGYPGVNDLIGFKHLKELGLPSAVPQEIFNKIIETQSNLEFLQIIEADTLLITDYSALQKLNDLRYLVIAGKNGPASSLSQMKRLKYLSLPNEFFEDSLQVVALKKALPDTVIVPNQGFCMGSGWLLLLLPLMAIGIFAGKKYFSKAA